MDTGWIQVFVLTLAECVAPAGKTVCQEQQVQYQFVDRQECETVLQQLVDYSTAYENVIVNAEGSSCLPTVVEQTVFTSVAEANEQLSDTEGWGVLEAGKQAQREDEAAAEEDSDTAAAHQQRLASLPACEDVNRRPPCKVGQIIVEAESGQELEVWRRD
jgi:hypothetical protein